MKKQFLGIVGLALAVVACQLSPTPVSSQTPQLLGKLEISFGGENGKAKATFSPSRLIGQALVNEAQLQFNASTYNTATETSGKKYLNARFTVRNLTGTNLNNLILVAYKKTGNTGNTALKSVVDFGGITATALPALGNSSLRAMANVVNYAKTVKPSHGMSGNGTVSVVTDQEDLVLFSEYDISQMTSTAGTALGSGEYLFPYGFAVRSLTNPNNTQQRTISNNHNTDTGGVTIAMTVDGSNEPTNASTYRFSLTALVFENPTSDARVSESLEEATSSTVTTRQTNMGTGTGLSSLYSSTINTPPTFPYSSGLFVNACQVRIAGNTTTPEGYLQSTAPNTMVSTKDPCFASQGWRVNGGGLVAMTNEDVAQLSDGRIVVVGRHAVSGTQSYLGVYRPDGSSVRDELQILATPTTDRMQLTSLAVDSLGRIIYAGQVVPATGVSYLVVGRNLGNNALDNDTSFSSNATVSTPIYTSTGSVHAITDVAIQSDNKIVAVGYVKNGTAGNEDVIVLRYTTTGALDTTFNTTGYRIIDVENTNLDNRALAVTIDTSGRIVVAGRHGATGSEQFMALRLTSTGATDINFNTVGYRIQNITGSTADAANSVVIQGTNILLGGYATTSSAPFALLRLTNSGAIDNTFGSGDGEVLRSSPTYNKAVAYKLLLQSDGKILVIGEESLSTLFRVFVSRFLADGVLDNTFNGTTNYQQYTLKDGAEKTTGRSAFISGSSTNGKLTVVGQYRPTGISTDWRGYVTRLNLGAN
jgi:uncharacterized delta-60 repeat protein